MNYLVPHATYPSHKYVCINGAPAYMNLIVFVVFCLIGPCNLNYPNDMHICYMQTCCSYPLSYMGIAISASLTSCSYWMMLTDDDGDDDDDDDDDGDGDGDGDGAIDLEIPRQILQKNLPWCNRDNLSITIADGNASYH